MHQIRQFKCDFQEVTIIINNNMLQVKVHKKADPKQSLIIEKVCIVECPVCMFNSSKPLFTDKSEHLILSCDKCRHEYLAFKPRPDHVSHIYSDDYFKGDKDGYPDYIQLEPLLIERGSYYSKIIRRFMEPGSMLDIGCGSGFIMKGFKDNGWEVKGVEPNLNMVKYGVEKFNLDISRSSFESYHDQNVFDLITMIQVIGHFYDVRSCIKTASRLLKTNGLLLIETWNKDSLIAKIMGYAWHEYSPPSVVNWFTPSSLKMLARQYKFKCIKSKRTLKRIQMRHAKSLLSRKSKKSFLIEIVEKMANLIPDETELIYPGDDLFYIIFKKSDDLT